MDFGVIILPLMAGERLQLETDGELGENLVSENQAEGKSKVRVTESLVIYVRRKIEEAGYTLLRDNGDDYFRIGLVEKVDEHLGFLKWNSVRRCNIANLSTSPAEYSKAEGDWLIWVYGKRLYGEYGGICIDTLEREEC